MSNNRKQNYENRADLLYNLGNSVPDAHTCLDFYDAGSNDKLAADFTTGMKNNVDGTEASWPPQVLEALYSEHPFLEQFSPEVRVVRSDPDGYAVGVAEFDNGHDTLRIPWVISDREILPFSVFLLDDKTLPLTEDRVLSTMSRQAAVDAVPKTDRHIEDYTRDLEIEPPDHSGAQGNMGNRYVSSKLAAITKVSRRHLEVLWDHAQKNDQPILRQMLEKRAAQQDFADDPDTWLVSRDNGYWVHPVNSHRLFDKQAQQNPRELSSAQVHQLFSPDVRANLHKRGWACVSASSGQLKLANDPEVCMAVTQGTYRVITEQGTPLVGNVFPRVCDLDGTDMMYTLFTDGDSWALQEQIAGELCEPGTAPEISGESRGHSVLAWQDPMGNWLVTPPFKVIGHNVATDAGPGYEVESSLGGSLRFVISGDALKPMEIAAETWIIPASWRVTNVGDRKVQLIPTQAGYTMLVDDVLHDQDTLVRAAGGDTVDIVTDAGTLIAQSPEEAELALTALGADAASEVLKVAAARGECRLRGDIPAQFPSAQLTVPAAADAANGILTLQKLGFADENSNILADDRGVDDVLNLGFVNEDNTSKFLEQISELEEAQEVLAQLSLASQLGYTEIPLSVVNNALTNVETLLGSLRMLITNSTGQDESDVDMNKHALSDNETILAFGTGVGGAAGGLGGAVLGRRGLAIPDPVAVMKAVDRSIKKSVVDNELDFDTYVNEFERLENKFQRAARRNKILKRGLLGLGGGAALGLGAGHLVNALGEEE